MYRTSGHMTSLGKCDISRPLCVCCLLVYGPGCMLTITKPVKNNSLNYNLQQNAIQYGRNTKYQEVCPLTCSIMDFFPLLDIVNITVKVQCLLHLKLLRMCRDSVCCVHAQSGEIVSHTAPLRTHSCC